MMLRLIKRFIAWLVLLIGQALTTAARPAGMWREVGVDGQVIIAHEITVAEMRQWLLDMRKAEEFVLLDNLLFREHEVSINDLLLMSSATRAFIEGTTATELAKLVAAVKEVNPFFFQFRQALNALNHPNP
jgi:hypothetical protein